MRRFISFLIGVPLAILLILFMVANRAPVTISLDPFAPETPALSVDMPLFIALFGALMLGVLVGGIADWVRQSHWRREARQRRAELQRLKAEKEQAASLPAHSNLPVLHQ